MKGIKKQKLPVIKQISHGDVNYSIENMVKTTVLTLETDGNQTYHGERFTTCVRTESLHARSTLARYRTSITRQ